MDTTNPTGNTIPPKNEAETGAAGTTAKNSSQSHPSSPSPQSSQPRESPKKPNTEPGLAQRVTVLREQSISPRRLPRSTIRRNTEQDLKESDPDIPYLKAEAAIRDLICSVLEREDRTNEGLLVRMIDLEYRIDDLETLALEEREKKGGSGS